MSNILSRVATCVLALLMLAGAYDVTSARAQSTGKKDLVSTTCKAGTVNACGEEPSHFECTRSWKFDISILTQTFGIGVGEVVCREVGKITVYKDNYAGKSANRCYLPPARASGGGDVMPIRTHNEDAPDLDEPLEDEESC